LSNEEEIALAVLSDLHINSTVALCPPVIDLDDRGTYHSSKAQRWLYKSYIDFLEKWKSRSGKHVLVINGDIGELDIRRRSAQLVAQNKATINHIIAQTLEPALEIADALLVIRGTSAHVGKSAWLEEDFAQDVTSIEVIKTPEGAFSWWSWCGKIGGVKFEITHHPSTMAGLPWNAKNAVNRMMSEILWKYHIILKQPPPQVSIFSHGHFCDCNSRDMDEVFVITTPGFQLATEYIYRRGKMRLAHIGGLLFNCKNGEYDFTPVLYRMEKERLWSQKI